jgi:rubrerythrin
MCDISESGLMEDYKRSHLEILMNAISMEIEGKEFFEEASGKVKHQRAKDTFISLVKQEQRHIDILNAELSRLGDGKGWASLAEMKDNASAYARQSVFKDKDIRRIRLGADAGELEVLKVGIEVEKKSIEYYRDAANQTTDQNARGIFTWLVGEEAGHLTILSAEYENRTGSGFYYDNMEFSLEVM